MMRIFKYGLDSLGLVSLPFSAVAVFILSFHGGETAIGATTLMMLILISVFKLSVFRFG